MPSVKVEKDRCKGCEHCVAACPRGVLAMSKEINVKGYFYSTPVNPHKCIGCTLCGVVCPDLAISIGVHGTQYNYFNY